MRFFVFLLAFLAVFSFEVKAAESKDDSAVVVINIANAENDDKEELNPAQLFEKQMLERRLKKEKGKKIKHRSGRRGKRSTPARSGSGSSSSRSLPSVANGMFVK